VANSLADAKDFIAMSSGPKTTEFYDADHALNAKVRIDRDIFLGKTLNLVPKLTLIQAILIPAR
jgi:hypothetical protein